MRPSTPAGSWPERRRSGPRRIAFGEDRRRLRVGLVNNMPDGALLAAERQFRHLLERAAPERTLDLQLFHIPAIARGEEARADLSRRALPVEAVEEAGLDALVVTGAEPTAAQLADEPFWPALARLADWAAHAQLPSLWSCLAAHAAVLRLDGVKRHPLPAKISGLYAALPVAAADPLLDGLGAPRVCPHSRGNGLEEADLLAAGYTVLTRSPEAGVDSFVRRPTADAAAPMLFLQGHPEYEPNTLALEVRRDLGRYLQGSRPQLPDLPHGVFGQATQDRLEALRQAAARERRPELMARWPAAGELQLATDSWRAPAARLCRNWLASAWEARAPAPVASLHGGWNLPPVQG